MPLGNQTLSSCGSATPFCYSVQAEVFVYPSPTPGILESPRKAVPCPGLTSLRRVLLHTRAHVERQRGKTKVSLENHARSARVSSAVEPLDS